MSPVILPSVPGGAVKATEADATEDVNGVQDVHQEPVKEVLNALMEEEQVSPALLATLFLVLGIVLFVAVMMKRLTTRPEMIQFAGHMKPFVFKYGSIVCPLDELYKQDIERRGFFRNKNICSVKTRPTRFISISEMWKVQQSKNNGKINIIPEEPEDTEGRSSSPLENNPSVVFSSLLLSGQNLLTTPCYLSSHPRSVTFPLR